MAKGSAMGLWKGKKGSTVFYKITNSNNGQKQGIRERVYDVSNPQTAAQSEQRMKLLPAQRIAGGLREIVERGWQGVEYGAKSRSAFLSAALKMGSGFPFLDKGDDRIVPGTFQLSKGSLSSVQCSFDENNQLITNFIVDDAASAQTWGDYSAGILSQSAVIKEGDQLTFAYCLCPQDSWQPSQPILNYDTMQFSFGYFSLFIDTNDETSINDLTDGNASIFVSPVGDYDYLALNSNLSDYDIVAATCIISRDNGNGGFLRSSQKLIVSNIVTDVFNTAQRKAKSKESYMKAEVTRSSDWPIDTDAEGGGSESYIDDFVAISGLTGAAATKNGTDFRVKRRISDNVITGIYYVQSTISGVGKCAVGVSGAGITYSDDGEVAGVSPAMLKAAMAILANAIEIAYRA